jgi:hypothetical protein
LNNPFDTLFDSTNNNNANPKQQQQQQPLNLYPGQPLGQLGTPRSFDLNLTLCATPPKMVEPPSPPEMDLLRVVSSVSLTLEDDKRDQQHQEKASSAAAAAAATAATTQQGENEDAKSTKKGAATSLTANATNANADVRPSSTTSASKNKKKPDSSTPSTMATKGLVAAKKAYDVGAIALGPSSALSSSTLLSSGPSSHGRSAGVGAAGEEEAGSAGSNNNNNNLNVDSRSQVVATAAAMTVTGAAHISKQQQYHTLDPSSFSSSSKGRLAVSLPIRAPTQTQLRLEAMHSQQLRGQVEEELLHADKH